MNSPAIQQQEQRPEYNYTLLRHALEQFKLPPRELEPQQLQQLDRVVENELAIGARLLAAKEAANVVVPEEGVERAVAQLSSRFNSSEEFEAELERNALNSWSLREALRYEMRVEMVMERLMQELPPVSDADVEIYYLQHVEKFTLPETRTTRQILITINDDYAENCREEVEKRIAACRKALEEGTDFAEVAQRYSECPSAMQEGVVGRVKPGVLFPELERVLFSLQEGELSEPVESELGLHLLWCEEIHPPLERGFDEVKEKLREHLEQKRRSNFLKQWLASHPGEK